MEITAELLHFVQQHVKSDLTTLLLQRHKYPKVDVALACRSIEARRKLAKKLPSWSLHPEIIVTDPVMVEQASSTETAQFKVHFLPSPTATVVDFSGGLGVDSATFAAHTTGEVHYVERSAERVVLARHNSAVLGLSNIVVHHGDAEEWEAFLPSTLFPSLIYIDPDRRAGGDQRRSFLIEESSPNLTALLPSLRSRWPKADLLIKLSPMVDLTYLHHYFTEPIALYIVSLNHECKEILVHFPSGHRLSSHHLYAVELTREGKQVLLPATWNKRAPLPLRSPHTLTTAHYLYDLYPSVAKIGIEYFPSYVQGLSKVHPHTHLYWSEERVDNFPGREFELLEVLPWSRQLSKRLRGERFHVVVKNVPMLPEQVMKLLGIKEGGEERYLFCFAAGEQSERYVAIAQRLHSKRIPAAGEMLETIDVGI